MKAYDIKKGNVVEHNGTTYQVRDIERSSPQGRGGNVKFRFTMYSVPGGNKFDLSLGGDDELREVELSRRQVTYSYRDGDPTAGGGYQSARPANSPVLVFTSTRSPLVMYSGTWISMPVDSFAGFGRLVAVPPLSSGGVSTTSIATLCGSCTATGISSMICT